MAAKQGKATISGIGEEVVVINEIVSKSSANTAHEQFELIMRRMMGSRGVDEAFKVKDQLGWVRAVNNIRNAAEEIIFSTMIYA
ncbi:MAG: TnpV protein [Lachnospiraceae bacterium]|nr:TnpV protein [Lachnospiraceae bacterium]